MPSFVINNTPHGVLQNAICRVIIKAVDTIYSDIIMVIVLFKRRTRNIAVFSCRGYDKGGRA